jgi:hypothetical protein
MAAPSGRVTDLQEWQGLTTLNAHVGRAGAASPSYAFVTVCEDNVIDAAQIRRLGPMLDRFDDASPAVPPGNT